MRGSGRGRARLGWKVSQEERHQEDVHKRNLKKEDPAEPHELVVTKARKRPADPDEEEKQNSDLREEDENVHETPAPAVGAIWHAGKMPAAEEERHDDRAPGNHGHVF